MADTNAFMVYESYLSRIKSKAEERRRLQNEFARKIGYNKFITVLDEGFDTALEVYEWNCVNEYRESVRAIIPLPTSSPGAIFLYRYNADSYGLKVLLGMTVSEKFSSWQDMKNYCIAWGLFQPPFSSMDKDGTRLPERFAQRLGVLDRAMLMEDVSESALEEKRREVQDALMVPGEAFAEGDERFAEAPEHAAEA